MFLNLYDKIKLKDGRYAHIVEIYQQGFAYEADIEDEEETYITETIYHKDIECIVP